MKRNIILLAVLAAIGFSAHASGLNLGPTTNNHGGKADATSVSGAAALAGAKADALSLATQNLVNGATTAQVAVNESERPVASAVATGLVAANGTCMGSTSAGAQGVTIGLTVGTTWTDSSCDARFDAQSLTALGHPTAALARLCQKAEIRQAVEATGQRCPEVAKAPASKPVARYEGNDPFVLRRLAAN